MLDGWRGDGRARVCDKVDVCQVVHEHDNLQVEERHRRLASLGPVDDKEQRRTRRVGEGGRDGDGWPPRHIRPRKPP
ncbi:hypothetical protein IF1G_10107 [Cordyceps javanica]|uniref:Uncharacterized protein n=1 Tax=Cordyceps javanica TaxID=43265 RepID=A0A545UP24_9HYPO|nr:hypothetical protein IF1G_10107 [Cordyceps javanica]